MRAREFITESNPVDYDGLRMSLTLSPNRPQLLVRALDDWDRVLGFAVLNIGDNNELDPQSLKVEEKYRNQNIAKKMYDFVKSKGYSIHRSSDQTIAGKEFWNKHRGREKVWEDEVDEMALPVDWDESMLGHDKSFKSRLEYALERAQKLRGGSSRTAFIIPDQGRETVLKIAKNRKGIAQNIAELGILKNEYTGKLPIVIPLIDYDKKNPEPIWIQTEKAQRVSEPILCKLLKCKTLVQFIGYVRYLSGKPSGQMWKNVPTVLANSHYSEEDIETFKTYATELAQLISSTDLLEADFWMASNWGVYNGRPVVLDLGYDTEVAKKYYGHKV